MSGGGFLVNDTVITRSGIFHIGLLASGDAESPSQPSIRSVPPYARQSAAGCWADIGGGSGQVGKATEFLIEGGTRGTQTGFPRIPSSC